MTKTTSAKSSREHVTACLTKLLLVCKPHWNGEDATKLALAAYIDELQSYDPQVVRYACEQWPRSGKRMFPWLSEIIDFIRNNSRDAAPALANPETDGARDRSEAILLLGSYNFRAKDVVRGMKPGTYRQLIAEAARLWSKVRPAGGLEELERVRGSRGVYGFALEAWARRHLDDDPLHVAYASASVRQVYQQLTGDDLLTMGTMPDLADTAELRRMAA